MIEIPKGSRNKYEYDKANKRLKFDRMLFSAMHHPSDYGFIFDTLGEDGDGLDAWCWSGSPRSPGASSKPNPSGCLKWWTKKVRTKKLSVCRCPTLTGKPGGYTPAFNQRNQAFFAVYKELESKKVGIIG